MKYITNFELKLPREWIQLFRIILSIYLIWMILLTPRKPIFNDNILTRFVFVVLLFLLVQSDILSGLLLIMIYFFSFQSVLPIVWEGFENEIKTETEIKSETKKEDSMMTSEPTINPEFLNKIEENLKRKSNVFPEETPEPTQKMILSYGTDKALKLK
jgi:hypothetical protein